MADLVNVHHAEASAPVRRDDITVKTQPLVPLKVKFWTIVTVLGLAVAMYTSPNGTGSYERNSRVGTVIVTWTNVGSAAQPINFAYHIGTTKVHDRIVTKSPMTDTGRVVTGNLITVFGQVVPTEKFPNRVNAYNCQIQVDLMPIPTDRDIGGGTMIACTAQVP